MRVTKSCLQDWRISGLKIFRKFPENIANCCNSYSSRTPADGWGIAILIKITSATKVIWSFIAIFGEVYLRILLYKDFLIYSMEVYLQVHITYFPPVVSSFYMWSPGLLFGYCNFCTFMIYLFVDNSYSPSNMNNSENFVLKLFLYYLKTHLRLFLF